VRIVNHFVLITIAIKHTKRPTTRNYTSRDRKTYKQDK